MRKKCIECGAPLEPANRADNPGARAQMKYCSESCKRAHKNRKYYAAHKPNIIQRILAHRRARREAKQK